MSSLFLCFLPLVRLNATKRVDSKFVRLNATNDEIKLQ